MKYFLLSLSLFISCNSLAHRAESGTATYSVGGLLAQSMTNSSYDGYDNDLMLGLHLGVTADMTDFSGLELNLNYINQFYYRDYNSQKIAERAQRMLIHFGYRYWPVPYFGLGAFVLTNFSMGKAKSIHQSATLSADFYTSAHESSDEGFSLSLVKEFVIQEEKLLNLDLRYLKYFHLPKGESDETLLLLFSFKTVKPKFI